VTASTVADLVDRRAALLRSGRDGGGAGSGELASVTAELRDALADGVPVLRRIGPADPLAHELGRREPVNPLAEPADLDRRLAPDRRLFAIEHPALPGRPMNVVWVALTVGVPTELGPILDREAPVIDPAGADTACFYSIWNAEPGLVGMGRGRQLIETSVDELRSELHGLETFVTLSPLPGFRSWLSPRGPQRPVGPDLLPLAARYLTSLDGDGRPVDPVARFHLANGARLWRLNADADLSHLGRQRSWGVMANYRYLPEDRAANRAELATGRVPVSPAVAGLAVTSA
jgi:malonyl-CoA decarboxylase